MANSKIKASTFCVLFAMIAILEVKSECMVGERGGGGGMDCVEEAEDEKSRNVTLAVLTVANLQLDNSQQLADVSFHNVTFTNVAPGPKISVVKCRDVLIERLSWPGVKVDELRPPRKGPKPLLCHLPFRTLLIDDHQLKLQANSCMTYERLLFGGGLQLRMSKLERLRLRQENFHGNWKIKVNKGGKHNGTLKIGNQSITNIEFPAGLFYTGNVERAKLEKLTYIEGVISQSPAYDYKPTSVRCEEGIIEHWRLNGRTIKIRVTNGSTGKPGDWIGKPEKTHVSGDFEAGQGRFFSGVGNVPHYTGGSILVGGIITRVNLTYIDKKTKEKISLVNQTITDVRMEAVQFSPSDSIAGDLLEGRIERQAPSAKPLPSTKPTAPTKPSPSTKSLPPTKPSTQPPTSSQPHTPTSALCVYPTADSLHAFICSDNITGTGTPYAPTLGGFRYDTLLRSRDNSGVQYPPKKIWLHPTWHRSICLTSPWFNCTLTWVCVVGHTNPV